MRSEDDARWVAILDELESRLGAYKAVLVGGAPPAPYALPGDLGTFPPALAARARRTLQRQGELEGKLRARMDALRFVLAGSVASRAEAVFVDLRA